MDKKEVKEIIRKNPSVDQELVCDGINTIKEFKKLRGTRVRRSLDVLQLKKARLVDNRDDLRHVHVSYQQY